MSVTHYTPAKLNEFIVRLRDLYDAVRVVDPYECRELLVGENGSVDFGESCFSVWGYVNRCENCTSYTACRTRERCYKEGIMEGYWKAPMTSAIKFSDLMQQLAKPLSIPDTAIVNLKYVVRWAQKHKADSTALPGGQLFRFCTSWESKVDQILDTLQFEVRCPVFETFVDERDGKTYPV